MSRLLDIAPEDRSPEQQEALDRVLAGRCDIPGPYKVWIHSPQVALGMEQIGTYLNKRGHLSTREVEIGILIIANHWGGEYVLSSHKRGAREAGIDDATIAQILAGERPTLADPHEQAVFDLASQMVGGGKPTDAEFAAYERVLKREGIAETLVLLGYYSSVALAMKLHDVPLKA